LRGKKDDLERQIKRIGVDITALTKLLNETNKDDLAIKLKTLRDNPDAASIVRRLGDINQEIKHLTESQVQVAVRHYFLIGQSASQHLKPASHGGFVSGPMLFNAPNTELGQVVNERFGNKVLSAVLVPMTTEPAELDAYRLVKADVVDPNQIKICALRKGAPWGLWVRVYIMYR